MTIGIIISIVLNRAIISSYRGFRIVRFVCAYHFPWYCGVVEVVKSCCGVLLSPIYFRLWGFP